ncbi:hypothetical protein [Oscillibacter sp.]|uniref:RNA polymerase sigma factor n=1 Tax=Oscillibacter sp. TaxID=1945593 RepID=UPI0028A07DFF|nr:hypothetical protein [Oscillibacter sp.]
MKFPKNNDCCQVTMRRGESMPQKASDTEKDRNFEALYRSNYAGLLRYATVILNSHGSNGSSVNGCAEEAVREMFTFAWENREKLLTHAFPVGWLYKCLYYKTLGFLKEDRVWTKRILQMSESDDESFELDFRLKSEMTSIISEDDYLLLKRLYLDGYTYEELCAELNLKKSALAMRIKRIKERFIKEYSSD